MSEAKFGENMVRASIDVDLGHLLHAAVANPSHRLQIEEQVVATAHDMFEAGQTEGLGSIDLETGKAYLRGFFDCIKLFESTEGQ